MYSLEKTQKIGLKLEDAWKFFSNPNNLPKITPPELNFKITNNPGDSIYPGQIITYKVTPILNIPLTWVTEIRVVEENKFFIDEQRVGPYSIWHHQHFFTAVEDGTLVRDLVHYQLPFAPLGNIGHFIVKKKLEQIFNYRSKAMSEML